MGALVLYTLSVQGHAAAESCRKIWASILTYQTYDENLTKIAKRHPRSTTNDFCNANIPLPMEYPLVPGETLCGRASCPGGGPFVSIVPVVHAVPW